MKKEKKSAERDELFEAVARELIVRHVASTGLIQRLHGISFERAARIMAQLQEVGVIGANTGAKPREVLMTAEQFETYLENKKTEYREQSIFEFMEEAE